MWTAKASSVLTNVTVRSTQAIGGFDQALTVVAFKGAVGIGNAVSASAANGAPTATFNDHALGLARLRASATTGTARPHAPLGPNQSMVHQWVDSAAGDTFWTQALNGRPVRSSRSSR